MKFNSKNQTAWVESEVDVKQDHFCLWFDPNYDSTDEHHTEEGMIVAHIGKPKDGNFPVSFATPFKADEQNTKAMIAAKNSLDFYLATLPAERQLDAIETWQYQLYHCGTAANCYGDLHWQFIKKHKHHLFAIAGVVATFAGMGFHSVFIISWLMMLIASYGFYRSIKWYQGATSIMTRLSIMAFNLAYGFLWLMLLINILLTQR